MVGCSLTLVSWRSRGDVIGVCGLHAKRTWESRFHVEHREAISTLVTKIIDKCPALGLSLERRRDLHQKDSPGR